MSASKTDGHLCQKSSFFPGKKNFPQEPTIIYGSLFSEKTSNGPKTPRVVKNQKFSPVKKQDIPEKKNFPPEKIHHKEVGDSKENSSQEFYQKKKPSGEYRGGAFRKNSSPQHQYMVPKEKNNTPSQEPKFHGPRRSEKTEDKMLFHEGNSRDYQDSYLSIDLPPLKKTGGFIVFEGGEGVGKSTQSKRLFRFLTSKGLPCILTREPGGTTLGSRVRDLIFCPGWSPEEELMLVLAARHHHWYQVIQPHLQKGYWVICDRFIDSSIVYQGLKKFLHHNTNPSEKELAQALQKAQQWTFDLHEAADLPVPLIKRDCTFLAQDRVHRALHRRHTNEESCNKFDYAEIHEHQRISQGFYMLAKENMDNYVILPYAYNRSFVTKVMIEKFVQFFRRP